MAAWQRTLWVIVVGQLLVSVGVMAPIWGTIADRRGRKPMLVRSLVGCGIFIGAVVLGRWSDQIGYRRVILLSALAGAFLHLVQPLTYDPLALIVMRALAGVALGGLMSASNALLAVVTASSSVGLAYGVADMARCAGRVVGPLRAAVMATQIDVGVGFVFAAVILAAVGVLAPATGPADRVQATTVGT